MKRLIICGLVLMGFVTASHAVSTLSKGYLSATPLDDGTIVSVGENPGIVKATNSDNIENLVGVVLKPENALLTVTSTAGEVQVVSEGIAMALLSTLEGDIKVGDRVTASSINGMGAKASKSMRVLGTAQASLDSKTGGAIKTKIKDKSGTEREVYMAKLPVLVGVTYYSTGEVEKPLVPSFVQKFANSVAAREVSQLPLVISIVIFLITLVASGIILFTAIRSSIVSIGRNPLSRPSIIRGLIQVVFLVMGLLGVGLAAIFLVLRLV